MKKNGEPITAPPKKARVGIYLLPSLMEEIRDATVALSGPPTSLTVTAFFDDAVRRELKHLKRSQNSGKDFPKRKTNPRRGRPVQ